MSPDPSRAETTSYNLLFVCTGNTCRSPMAAAVTRAELERRGWTHVQVRSAGMAAASGAPASEHALAVMAEQGIDLHEHRSQAVTSELLDWADLVLAMSTSHVFALNDLGAGAKVTMVTDFLEGEDAGRSVDDPYGGSVDAYRQTAQTLARAVTGLLDRLEPILAP